MTKHTAHIFYLGLLLFFCAAGCSYKEESADDEETLADARTAVAIGYPSDTVHLEDEITLNAIASYLLKSDVKANSTGYITSMRIKLGDRVGKGKVLFGLQTKEARALGNTINRLDKSFQFNGSTTVISPATGYVAMVNHQVGDYVQDGEVLATITDASSFGFVLNLPYEYNKLIRTNKTLLVHLPDGQAVTGYVARTMPAVDSVSQTQKILVKVYNDGNIPENLIGTIKLSRYSSYGLCIPKASLVADETQSVFWVMKLINDSTAVKTEIEPGIETAKWVQVKKGNLSVTDRVVTSGNFGLGDTAAIQIQK